MMRMASRNFGRAWLLTVLMLSSACSTLPARDPQALAMPSEFSAGGEAAVPDRWWSGFDDPALNGLVERALQRNFSLASVWARLDQAAALERINSAGLFPTLDVNGSAGRNWSRNPFNVGTNTTTSGNSFSLGAAASYEVDLWGRVNSTRTAAQLDRQASEAELSAAAVSLSAQVANTWYRLVEQYGQRALLQSQFDTNEQVLELITLRFRRGKVGASDVLQQRQLVESTRGELATTESALRVLEHQLAILLGETPGTRIAEPRAVLVDLPVLPATGVPAELLQRRPDLRQSWLSLQAADRRTAAAVADRFPRISLSASGSTTDSNASDLFDSWLSNVAANLLLPVIDGGRRRAEADRNRAVAEQLLNDYRQQLLDALGEVEDALVQEQQQQALIASLDKQLVLSKQVIERVRDSYAYGAVDYLRILDALLTDQNLERNRLSAQRQLIEYRIALYRALAGGWALQRPALATQTTLPGDSRVIDN